MLLGRRDGEFAGRVVMWLVVDMLVDVERRGCNGAWRRGVEDMYELLVSRCYSKPDELRPGRLRSIAASLAWLLFRGLRR